MTVEQDQLDRFYDERSHDELVFICFDVLRRLGPAYVAALSIGLKCRRTQSGYPDSLDRRVLALTDIVTESPEIALQALREFANSNDPSERAVAARALDWFSPSFPTETEEVLNRFLVHEDAVVRAHGRTASMLIALSHNQPDEP